MSRYNLTAKPEMLLMHIDDTGRLSPKDDVLRTLELNFGFDRTLGYFFDIFEEGKEEPLVEAYSQRHGVTKTHMVQVVDHYASEEEKVLLETQLTKLALDLPF